MAYKVVGQVEPDDDKIKRPRGEQRTPQDNDDIIWWMQTLRCSEEEARERVEREKRNARRRANGNNEDRRCLSTIEKLEKLERGLEFMGDANPEMEIEQWIRKNTRMVLNMSPWMSAKAARREAIKGIEDYKKDTGEKHPPKISKKNVEENPSMGKHWDYQKQDFVDDEPVVEEPVVEDKPKKEKHWDYEKQDFVEGD